MNGLKFRNSGYQPKKVREVFHRIVGLNECNDKIKRTWY